MADAYGADPYVPGLGGVVSRSGPAPTDASGPAPSGALQQTLSEFPSYAWMLNIPELQGIILSAVTNKIPSAELQSQLEATQWWQQHSASVRQWMQLVNTDNASAKAAVDAESSKIQNLANKLGVDLNDAYVNSLANQALQFNWNDDQLQQAVVANFHYSSNAMGQAGLVRTQLLKMAQDYMLPVSDDTIQRWTTDVIAGRNVADNFQQELIQQAKSRYASNQQIIEALDKGVTMKDIVTPFQEQAAQLLDVAPASIDFTDPKWAGAIDHIGADGVHTLPNIEDFRSTLMTDPQFGFDRTSTARQMATSVISSLGQRMGVIAS